MSVTIQKEIKPIFRAYNTMLELLDDRKYDLDDSYRIDDIFQFYNLLKEKQIEIFCKHKEDTSKHIYIRFFTEGKNFQKKDLISIVQGALENTENPNLNIILVLEDKPNSTVLKEMGRNEFKNVEIFTLKSLSINITKHSFVPKHVLLNDEELKKLLNTYQCTKSQLPRIDKKDPVACYYGMKPGDVCRIERPSETTGTYYYYRLVR